MFGGAGEHIEVQYVYLAYETLLIFMKEIVKRTRKCLSGYSLNEAHELEHLSQTALFPERFIQKSLFTYGRSCI